ncbi:ABC transporter permease [Rhodoferax lacus]|uniref:ABC transporter permease n=1 Tax=Rhodoferax lacus TaxID=2184758 RepID=UPI0018F38F4B|nr:ABC transporter permease [Rhodoferax lacus]
MTTPIPATTGARRPGIWRIAGYLSRRQYWLFAALGLLLPFVAWGLVSAYGGVDSVFLPGPLQVLQRSVTWLLEDDLLQDAGISIYRVLAGFVLSAVLALPIGVLIGAFRPVEALLEPLTDFIRYMPAVAFIPLVMLWFGIGESAKISIIFIGTFFQMVLMIAENVRLVPMAQIEAALTMGATRNEMISLVLGQSARPAILDTFRITMGWAWTYLVVAELVAANSGLGYAILKAQRFLKTDTIFAGIILIGLIGLLMDQGFRWLHRRLYPWAHLKG